MSLFGLNKTQYEMPINFKIFVQAFSFCIRINFTAIELFYFLYLMNSKKSNCMH